MPKPIPPNSDGCDPVIVQATQANSTPTHAHGSPKSCGCHQPCGCGGNGHHNHGEKTHYVFVDQPTPQGGCGGGQGTSTGSVNQETVQAASTPIDVASNTEEFTVPTSGGNGSLIVTEDKSSSIRRGDLLLFEDLGYVEVTSVNGTNVFFTNKTLGAGLTVPSGTEFQIDTPISVENFMETFADGFYFSENCEDCGEDSELPPLNCINAIAVVGKREGDSAPRALPLSFSEFATYFLENLSTQQKESLRIPIGGVLHYNKESSPGVGENPSIALGYGTWVQTAQGRTLVGVDPSDSDFAVAGETGGEKEHVLTIDEMPSHTHKEQRGLVVGNSESDNNSGVRTDFEQVDTGPAGGDQPHNNLQPYQTTYIWERTA